MAQMKGNNDGKKFDIFYFSSTHWDREWYQEFQGFRYRLVKMADGLIDLLEKDEEYKTFHFDGQTIVLDDYVEICPEKRKNLEKLIEDKRLIIGPWYVMPDEFLVSGESLIRNLMIGHEKAKEWGAEPWKYGYICDIFGHIAQMPQIFNGFSIKYSILGRGTDENDPTFFVWQAPDGSECLNFRLAPDNGYGEFACCVYDSEEDQTLNNPLMEQRIKEFVDKELERSNVPIVMAMDGFDHRNASVNTTDYIKTLKKLYPEARVHHVNLVEQGKLLENYRDELPVIKGELNKTAIENHIYLHLITNTLSSYYTIKKENDECQNLLEKTLEPLLYLAKKNGVELKRNYVKLAYKNLIQNQPHDSICGCSLEQVHKDMEYRYAQVKEIGKVLKEDFLYSVKKDSKAEEYENVLTLYNTLPFEIDKTVSVDLLFKPGYPSTYFEPFGYETINAFKIYDYEGREIPYQITDIKRNFSVREYADYRKFYDLHKVTMRVKVPAMGTAEYKIVPAGHSVRYLKKLESGSNYAENEFIRLNILSNGTLEILDKKTGKVYSNLCGFVDDGEIGDGWYHANPVNDIKVYSDGLGAVIEKIESGPSKCVFKVTRYMEVPKEIPREDADMFRSKKRSEEKVVLKLVMTVGLSEEARRVDVKLNFDNTAKDHRLKLMIPTGITEDKYFAGQAFYMCERKTGIDYGTQDWLEPEQYEKATNGIVGKRDKNGDGLAFVSAKGIHECAAFNDESGLISVTLLRAFRTVTLTNGETRCQLNRPLEYEFALMPLDNDVKYKYMLKEQDIMATELLEKFVCTEKNAPLNPPKSYLSVEGENVVTSVIKCAEDSLENALVVRVFNASAQNSSGEIKTDEEIKKVESVNLNEEYLKDIPFEANRFEFELTPWQIKTFKIYI